MPDYFTFPFTWNITNNDDVDFDFQVQEQEPEWVRDLDGRIAENPCTGARTAIIRGDGTLRKLRTTINVAIRPLNGTTADTRLSTFANAWNAVGPYTLTMPSGRTKTVIFDPEVQWREQRIHDGHGYRVVVGLAEQ